MTRFDVIGMGTSGMDIISSPNGKIEIPGGAVANSIVTLSRLGVKTGYIGRVGKDENGKKVMSAFEQDDVDISRFRIDDLPTSQFHINVTPQKREINYKFYQPVKKFDTEDMNLLIFSIIFPGVPYSEVENEYYKISYAGVPMPGAREVINALHEQGYPLYIATSRNPRRMLERLEEAEIDHSKFMFVVSLDGMGIQKPDPRIFTGIVAEELAKVGGGLSLDRSTYLGDHPSDLGSSMSARKIIGGPLGIGVVSGYHTREELLGTIDGEELPLPSERLVLDTISEFPGLVIELEGMGVF